MTIKTTVEETYDVLREVRQFVESLSDDGAHKQECSVCGALATLSCHMCKKAICVTCAHILPQPQSVLVQQPIHACPDCYGIWHKHDDEDEDEDGGGKA